jgi:hypothetical protein
MKIICTLDTSRIDLDGVDFTLSIKKTKGAGRHLRRYPVISSMNNLNNYEAKSSGDKCFCVEDFMKILTEKDVSVINWDAEELEKELKNANSF